MTSFRVKKMMQEEELTERLLNQSKSSDFDAAYQVISNF